MYEPGNEWGTSWPASQNAKDGKPDKKARALATNCVLMNARATILSEYY